MWTHKYYVCNSSRRSFVAGVAPNIYYERSYIFLIQHKGDTTIPDKNSVCGSTLIRMLSYKGVI